MSADAKAEHEEPDYSRLVVVSNRLPVVLSRDSAGRPHLAPGHGGVVTALAPVLRNRGGTWIGWSGSAQPDVQALLADASQRAGYTLVPVPLTAEDERDFYYGFSNQVLWPMFHDLVGRAHFAPRYWRQYQIVNRKFAEVIATVTKSTDYVWVHDYHLMLVANQMAEMSVRRRLGFFLHIPFPPLDVFVKIPWRADLLRGLLRFELIGFQTARDRGNFLQCLRRLVRSVHISRDGPLSVVVLPDGHRVRVGSFPISIDFQEFSGGAASREVAEASWYLHEKHPERQIILGVDRLDYTKGIPQRLDAYELALQRYPELHERIVLMQVVVPSRDKVPEYDALKRDIERRVGEINGRYTRQGWVPIHYIYRSLPRMELLAHYRTAEIALVTPLKDGMNLVAKEFCAASTEGQSVLILSEFAGAAAQLHRGAILVNPYDVEGMADALHQAVLMPPAERRERMRRLRNEVRRYNIYWWLDRFLDAAFGRRLSSFAVQEAPFEQIEFV
jgi:trehalose 6-phosphate synthase/phosphatase